MPRKGLRPRDRREAPPPDFKFNSVLISRFVNRLNFQGKKSIAEKIVYDSLTIIADKTKEDALMVFTKAIENVRPILEVKARRVGGANYQVPIEVRPARQQALSLKWIVGAAKAKKGKPMAVKLSDEIVAASKNEGEAVKKRENTHKMAEANKAFAHFSW